MEKYLTIIFFIIFSCFCNAQIDRFKIQKTNNSYKLISPTGSSFFSLGITHTQALNYPNSMKIFVNKYKNDWSLASAEIYRNLISWEFNTAGYGAPKELRKLIPFMMPSQPLVGNSSWLEKEKFFFSDIFDFEVKKEILNKIQNMTSEKDNPNLIGYFWTDMPMWNLKKSKEKFGFNWVDYIKNLPENSAGRIRYEKFKNEQLFDNSLTFEENFLKLIAKEYYKLIGEETKRLDPGALIFGERYAMHRVPTYIIEEALPYIDVVSIQPHDCDFNENYFRKIHEIAGKPIIICDHQCSFPTKKYRYTMWQQLNNQTEVAEKHSEYLNEVVNESYLIGYHRCQYIDRYEPTNNLLKQGMVKENGETYEPHASIITRTNKKVKEIFKEKRK
jgi:hypothetical protein